MGEINENDEFGKVIIDVVTRYNLQKVLEIGSWDGTGSTQCFIKGMSVLTSPDLTCVEVKRDRYEKLVKNTQAYSWVKCVNQTTISLKALIDKDFESLWNSNYCCINSDKSTVREWFDHDIEEITKYNHGFLETDQRFYDGVLIDGGEFFGYSEYKLVKDRTNVLFLDDYYSAFKNNQSARELTKDPEWEVVAGNRYCRNGYAVFKRRNFK
jgi:hypothetical protein